MSLDAIQYARAVQPQADGEKLLPSERHLLLLLATYHNQAQNAAWPSVGRLARQTGLSDRRVQQIIRSLQRKGLLRVVYRADHHGTQPTNLYTFPGLGEWQNMPKPASPSPEASFTPPADTRDGEAKPSSLPPEAQFTNPANRTSPSLLQPASPYKHLESEKKERENQPPESEFYSFRDVLKEFASKHGKT